MQHLISIRSNIIYSKISEGEKEEYKKFFELIFLVDKPEYRFSTEGEIIRERAVAENRLVVSEKMFDKFIELLTKIKDAKDSDFE